MFYKKSENFESCCKNEFFKDRETLNPSLEHFEFDYSNMHTCDTLGV